MKRISQLFAFVLLALAVVSCDKKQDLTNYADGTAPQLSVNNVTIAPTAADSNNAVVTFKWTDPQYQINSNTKYILQIDSAGKNFSNPFTRELIGANTTSIIAKDLNNWMLGRGYAFNVPVSMQARLISSHANNNDRLTSNVIAMTLRPYLIPPRVAVPASDSLVIVGAATEVGWTNNNPAQRLQKFVKINATTWAGIFRLNGGQEFLILPEAGNWDKKYAMSDNNVPNVGSTGTFGYKGPGTPNTFDANFKAPAATGLYRIELDFQMGRYTITPWSGMLTPNFYVTGAATGDGWANSATPPASQTFTRISSSEYVLTTTLQGGQEFLILPVAGSWDQKYALADNSVAGISAGGQFGYKGAGTPGTFDANFKAPATTGTYTIRLNLAAPVTPGSGASGRFTIQ
ncbi:SusE domain-containing protein [Flaviaesturariibacter amylovorans]|uniref:SusE outer membrane protein domain-containing protein n=1 Tax=Flaviaesturariibacter amylovorans TaxID=1084520 RepID=A0ABP8HQA0_9BACT